MSAHTTNLPVSAVPGWSALHPWLHAGTTRQGPDGQPDFRLPSRAMDNWHALLAWSGCSSVVRSRQVHETAVQIHHEAPRGLVLAPDGDGHATQVPGLLLAVTVADCAPVFLADPVRRAIAVLHAGWRGTAAGIVDAGVLAFRGAFQSEPSDLLAHVGPTIGPCCYEVGPEVLEALDASEDKAVSDFPASGAQPRRATPATGPSGRAFLDLGAVVQDALSRLGLAPENISRNPECTRCDRSFFSHRRGDEGRHVAFAWIGAKARPPRPQ